MNNMSTYTYYLVRSAKKECDVFAVLRITAQSGYVPGTLEILAGELNIDSQSPRELSLYSISEENANVFIQTDERCRQFNQTLRNITDELLGGTSNSIRQTRTETTSQPTTDLTTDPRTAPNPQLNQPVNKSTP